MNTKTVVIAGFPGVRLKIATQDKATTPTVTTLASTKAHLVSIAK